MKQVVHIYLGDLCIVASIYFFVVFAFPSCSPRLAGILVFSFAVLTELLQLTGLPSAAGVPHFLAFWIGQVFDFFDIAVYGFGVLSAIAVDTVLRKRLTFR